MTSPAITEIRDTLAAAGHEATIRNDVVEVETVSGTVGIAHLDEPATYDKIGGGAYTVPAGWRAVHNPGIAPTTIVEGADKAALMAALTPLLPAPVREKPSPFDGPFSAIANDELSTEHVTNVFDVHDEDGNLIGQVGLNDEPTRHGWVARKAWYAERGDVDGQITGWAGPFGQSWTAAKDALIEHSKR